jgi:hypothetical protein
VFTFIAPAKRHKHRLFALESLLGSSSNALDMEGNCMIDYMHIICNRVKMQIGVNIKGSSPTKSVFPLVDCLSR